MEINGIELKKGNKMSAETLKANGFKRLSKFTFTNGEIKVELSGKKIKGVQKMPSFKQRIDGFRSKSGGSSNHYANQVVKGLR